MTTFTPAITRMARLYTGDSRLLSRTFEESFRAAKTQDCSFSGYLPTGCFRVDQETGQLFIFKEGSNRLLDLKADLNNDQDGYVKVDIDPDQTVSATISPLDTSNRFSVSAVSIVRHPDYRKVDNIFISGLLPKPETLGEVAE